MVACKAVLHCRQYFSRWALLCVLESGGRRVTWTSLSRKTERESVEIGFSPLLCCVPQLCVSSLFSPSSFLFCKWEFLSFTSFNRNNWNGPIVGSPGGPQTHSNPGPKMDAKPSTARLFFSWDTGIEQRESNRSQRAQSSLILWSWLCCLASSLLLFAEVWAYLIFSFH